jgi:hypothetical protein
VLSLHVGWHFELLSEGKKRQVEILVPAAGDFVFHR